MKSNKFLWFGLMLFILLDIGISYIVFFRKNTLPPVALSMPQVVSTGNTFPYKIHIDNPALVGQGIIHSGIEKNLHVSQVYIVVQTKSDTSIDPQKFVFSYIDLLRYPPVAHPDISPKTYVYADYAASQTGSTSETITVSFPSIFVYAPSSLRFKAINMWQVILHALWLSGHPGDAGITSFIQYAPDELAQNTKLIESVPISITY